MIVTHFAQRAECQALVKGIVADVVASLVIFFCDHVRHEGSLLEYLGSTWAVFGWLANVAPI